MFIYKIKQLFGKINSWQIFKNSGHIIAYAQRFIHLSTKIILILLLLLEGPQKLGNIQDKQGELRDNASLNSDKTRIIFT